jgi:hypothetical protein
VGHQDRRDWGTNHQAVRERFADWQKHPNRCVGTINTYCGPRTAHELFEALTWHAATSRPLAMPAPSWVRREAWLQQAETLTVAAHGLPRTLDTLLQIAYCRKHLPSCQLLDIMIHNQRMTGTH